MKRALGFLLVTSLVLFACGQAGEVPSENAEDTAPVADVGTDEAAVVRALVESWDPISNAEDLDGMMGLFTADPIRLNAGEPPLIGAAACRADFEAGFASGNNEGNNPIDDIQVAGSWAFARGTFTDKATTESGEITEETGKWVSILRKSAGGWKYAVDIWNRDAPSANAGSSDDFDRGELPAEVTPSGADEEAIVAVSKGWDAANNAEDVDTLLGLYAVDAIRMAADEPMTQGTEAIRERIESGWATQKPDGTGPILGLEVEGDWAYMWGTWTDRPTVKATGEVLEDSGKWLNVLLRTPEGWKIQVEIWNRDTASASG
jgi:ketosteroid isomerase-like protein